MNRRWRHPKIAEIEDLTVVTGADTSTGWDRLVRIGSLTAAMIGLVSGGLGWIIGLHRLSDGLWIATSAIGIALSVVWVVQAAAHRRIGVDLIALAAIVGTLFVGEYVAGALITVMLTTGRALEGWAAGRAERDLRLLLEHAPVSAHRYHGDTLADCALDAVAVGDVLMVQSGEVVPVDGTLLSWAATIDESALTGESLPVSKDPGEAIRSGVVNAGSPFDLVATTTSAESTFAGIVRLVEQASASSSPFVRLADRFAIVFLAVSFAAAGAAWIVSGEGVRAVAVLVVATPCPMILAAPVAIVAGLSRCARRGVVVKGGGALEALASADVLLFDKTGTLTAGRPTIIEVIAADGFDPDQVLRLAASLDQVSPHVVATAIVRSARDRGLDLVVPTETTESAGDGVRGLVGSQLVTIGKAAWTGVEGDEEWVARSRSQSEFEGALCVFVAVDGIPAGALLLADPIRTDAARTIRNLRRNGIRRVVMVTGDRHEIATSVGAMVGVDAIAADQSPADKVDVVRRETAGGSTIMVGDGVNDAPALAAATVGVAIGARGSTASSETADIVLTVDRLDRLGEAHLIARRARTIAVQSVVAGMAMSVAAMAAAAFGLLPPAAGALLQECIDIAVILNALRALRVGGDEVVLDETGEAIAQHFAEAHRNLRPDVATLRDTADLLGSGDLTGAMVDVHRAYRLLVDEIGPHEADEDRMLYPIIADALGGTDPTGTMSRAHAEISRLTAQLTMVVERIGAGDPDATDVRELQRLLYGLYALLELHFAQEDESFLSLAESAHPLH
ncbi:MAG: heavy metal translocating P-type ATPase [Ilumatobacteraceae bacterium]